MKSLTTFPSKEFDQFFDSMFRGTLGFDNLIPVVQNIAKTTTFPPYNIQKDDNTYTLTIAVAGYTKNDIVIEIEAGNLVIRSVESGGFAEDVKEFLHRGIASRKWRLAFKLSGQLLVKDAKLENGLLVINLIREEPENTTKTIEIKG